MRGSLATIIALGVLVASCGGGSDDDAGSDSGSASDGAEVSSDEAPADTLDLSFDLDELTADAEAAEAELADVDLTEGFQCPIIDNQRVADLAPTPVAGVEPSSDGCRFYFGFAESDPMVIDAFTQGFVVDSVQESADILMASTGGRAIEVPNALAAYVYEDGFLPDNLPPQDADGDGVMDPGRQAIGNLLGSRGVRVVAVFPDAVVGIYDGSDAARDEAVRADFFAAVMTNSAYASS